MAMSMNGGAAGDELGKGGVKCGRKSLISSFGEVWSRSSPVPGIWVSELLVALVRTRAMHHQVRFVRSSQLGTGREFGTTARRATNERWSAGGHLEGVRPA